MDVSSTNPAEYDVYYNLITFGVARFKFDEFDSFLVSDQGCMHKLNLVLVVRNFILADIDYLLRSDLWRDDYVISKVHGFIH